MATVFNILIIIASVLLILVVLVQNSKGGGISSNFTSGGQIMDVKRSTDFIEKATWGLAIALVIFCLGSTMNLDKGTPMQNKSVMEESIEGDAATDMPVDESPAE